MRGKQFMNFLAEHIEKLLISNDCVVVSSLGGFIKNRKTAAIMGNRIVPPMVEISFNSMLRHDDGLLCSLIAEENDISYKSALALMNRYIEEFRQRLINEKNVVFGNIGLFTYVDDTVIFTPYEANYLPENFGLAPIEVEERRRVQKIGETIEFDNDSITINITEIKQKVVRYAGYNRRYSPCFARSDQPICLQHHFGAQPSFGQLQTQPARYSVDGTSQRGCSMDGYIAVGSSDCER